MSLSKTLCPVLSTGSAEEGRKNDIYFDSLRPSQQFGVEPVLSRG